MGLKQKTSDLQRRMRDALMGGGEKAIEKQKAIGKLTARERIIALLDPKSFHEYDLLWNMRPKILTWTKNTCQEMG